MPHGGAYVAGVMLLDVSTSKSVGRKSPGFGPETGIKITHIKPLAVLLLVKFRCGETMHQIVSCVNALSLYMS